VTAATEPSLGQGQQVLRRSALARLQQRRQIAKPAQHPSRAMTQDQAAKVLKTASGRATRYVKAMKASKGRYGATHAATETGELACGTKPHKNATITEVSVDHEQQRRAHPRDQRHRRPQVNPRHGNRVRHVIVPAIRGGASVMDDVFGDEDDNQENSGNAKNA